MTLIACRECGAKISSAAKTCPQCGAKPPRRTSTLTRLAAIVVILGLVGGIVMSEREQEQQAAAEARREAAMTPEQRAAEARSKREEEAQFQRGVLLLRALRKSMKNPDSFKFEAATLMADGTFCIEYRATNSFNAIVPGYLSAPTGGRPLTSDDAVGETQWNRLCAGKHGTNMKHIRHAM